MQFIPSDLVICGKSGSVEWHNARAVELFNRGTAPDVQPEVGLDLLHESAGCFKGLIELWDDSPLYWDWIAECEAGIANALSKLGRTNEAVVWREKSIARHQRLQRQKYLEPQTSLKLAQSRLRLGTELQEIDPRKSRTALAKSCRGFKRLLGEGRNDCWVHYSLAARLLTALERGTSSGEGARHAKHASTICDEQPANFQKERLTALLESKQPAGKAVRSELSSIGTTVAYCLPMLIIPYLAHGAGVFLPLIQLLLLFFSSTWIQKSQWERAIQGVCVLLFGLATGLVMAWLSNCQSALVLMPMTAVPALLAVVFFEQLQRRFTLFYRSTSWMARASRQVDGAADEWIAWILRNVPRAMHRLLLRRGTGEASVELRWCLQWAVCGYVFANEFSVHLMDVICSIDQVVDAPVRPPRVTIREPLVNTCASWSVRLRRPIHSPRSDGVLICA